MGTKEGIPLVLQVPSNILSLIFPCSVASPLIKHLQVFKNHEGLSFKSPGLDGGGAVLVIL